MSLGARRRTLAIENAGMRVDTRWSLALRRLLAIAALCAPVVGGAAWAGGPGGTPSFHAARRSGPERSNLQVELSARPSLRGARSLPRSEETRTARPVRGNAGPLVLAAFGYSFSIEVLGPLRGSPLPPGKSTLSPRGAPARAPPLR